MKNEKKIWFTSDTHFGHKNIIRFSNRPFNDEDHMNEELIKAWNEVVGEDDDVYHLGDVSLTNDEKTNKILQRLNGKIYLIKGNHEKSVLNKENNRKRFEWIKDYHELSIETDEFDFNVPTRNKNQSIVMCHYAMRVWNRSHHQSIHLYGHSHDSLDKEGMWGKSMDVGVDSAYRILGSFRPFSYEEIKKIMEGRGHNPVDHHLEIKLRKEGHIK